MWVRFMGDSETPSPSESASPITFPEPLVPITNETSNQTGTYVRDRTGTMIPVKNFKNEAIRPDVYGEDTLLVAESVGGDGQVFHQIFYYVPDGSITISLLSEPLSNARANAEAEIRSLLGLSDDDICTLDIRVTVPLSVNEALSGRNLGLGFCPFAADL